MPKSLNVDISRELATAQAALVPATKRLTKLLGTMVPARMPVGSVVDAFYAIRSAKAALAALVKPISEDVLDPAQKQLEDFFIDNLAVGESSGVQGQVARVQVSSSPQPVVRPEDWEKFFQWVAKTRQWELLQRKVSKDAVRERWDNKKQVKYVSVFNAKTVSCTKLNGKGR